jgi:hypothetical protein
LLSPLLCEQCQRRVNRELQVLVAAYVSV